MFNYKLLFVLCVLFNINLSRQQHISLSVLDMNVLHPLIAPFTTNCLNQLNQGGINCNRTVVDERLKSDLADKVRSDLKQKENANAQRQLQNLACCAGYDAMECVVAVAKDNCNSAEFNIMNKWKNDNIRVLEAKTCSGYHYQSDQCNGTFMASPVSLFTLAVILLILCSFY